MTTPGLQVDQVAPAFVCVPGVTVEMLAASVTGTRSTNSTSFVGIGVPGIAEPGDMIATFVAPVSGTYKLDVVVSLYANPGSNFGYMRLVFDYDTTPIYVGGGNDWKFAHYLNDVRRYSFFDIVNLTAGTHKVKFEWKVVGGTIFADTAIGIQWKVRGTAVTGSGAGGTIITKVTETTAQTISSVYPTWVDITDLTVNVTTSANERVHIHTSVYANPTGTPIDPFLRVLIDGTAVGFYEEGEGANFSVEARIVLWSSPLTAGSHTIKVQGCKYTGHANWVVDVTGYSYLEVAQFRGGLVPVRKDGASIIDTPAAFDFTGPGCQVANVGGTAKISLIGAEGVTGTAVESSLTPQTISSVQPTYTDLTGLTKTITTTAVNEIVLVTVAGQARTTSGAGTPIIAVLVDGVIAHVNVAWTGTSTATMNTSFSVAVKIASPGSHTIKLAGAKHMSGESNWTVEPGPIVGFTPVSGWKFDVVQFKGGYVIPENIPYLEYNSASQIHLHATPGAISTLRAALNDGKIYTVTAPLTVDLTVSGRGGLDTGTEAVSTWYYVYLVPDGAGTGLSALCSVTAPATGPTGYAIWRYVGAFRNDASGNILKFRQLGNRFLHELSTIVAEAPTTGTSEAAPGTLLPDLVANGHVPVSAGKALVIAWIGQGGSADQWVLQLRDNSTDTVLTCHNQSYSGGANTWAEVPLPVSTKKFYRRIYRAGGSAANADYYAIYCSGYDDEYLAGLQSQLQAKYSPDTKLARLVYNAVGAVDVAAGVGQPSTVLLTLQDGKQRSFSGTLAWAFANGVADLGLDTGAEASSTWYYMYAVPKTGDDNQLSVRASITPPTTGPTGYTNFKYLGAFRNDGSSNIIKFRQIGKYFSWYYRTQPAASTGWGTTFQTPKIEIAIDDTVPLTAEAVEVFSTLEINHNTSDYVYQEIFIEGESTSQTYCRLNLNRGKMRNYTNLPLIGVASKKIGYRTYDNGSGGTIWLQNFNVNGWWDEYL